MIRSNGHWTFCIVFFLQIFYECSAENDRPIIGVLTQRVPFSMRNEFSQYSSFISASYVKFLEGAGARVAPVWIGQKESYYEDIVKKTNGILFPGGAEWFNTTNGYGDAGCKIYNIAKNINLMNDYYPIFGICLGFELMMYCDARKKDTRKSCSGRDIALPLVFQRGYTKSTMYKNAPKKIIQNLKKENLTSNYHKFCYDEELLRELDILHNWKILTTSNDTNGFPFISSIESREYPFYGVQFHPEKNIYEWYPRDGNPHTSNAVECSQYYANMFVNEAKKNNHEFREAKEEQEALIYNFNTVNTGKLGYKYTQSYFFQKTDHGKKTKHN